MSRRRLPGRLPARLAACLLLAACSGDAGPGTGPAPEPPPVPQSIFEPDFTLFEEGVPAGEPADAFRMAQTRVADLRTLLDEVALAREAYLDAAGSPASEHENGWRRAFDVVVDGVRYQGYLVQRADGFLGVMELVTEAPAAAVIATAQVTSSWDAPTQIRWTIDAGEHGGYPLSWARDSTNPDLTSWQLRAHYGHLTLQQHIETHSYMYHYVTPYEAPAGLGEDFDLYFDGTRAGRVLADYTHGIHWCWDESLMDREC